MNRLPILIIILVIVFLITSLLSFIAMEKVVAPEKAGVSDNSNAQIGMNEPPKTADAVVAIEIVKNKLPKTANAAVAVGIVGHEE